MEDDYLTRAFYVADYGDPYAYGQNKLSMVSSSSLNNETFLHPSPQSATPQSSAMAQAHLKRQISDVTHDRAEKKRLTDKAYRQRCKEAKEKTTRELGMLTGENDQLRKENGFLKKEEIQLKQSFESQKVEMERLKKELGQLKGELSRQNTVVEVLSNRLAGCKDVTCLQHDNAQLKCQIDLLKKRLNNPNDFDIIQLQGKVAQLEHKNRAFHVIIDALCQMINNKDHEQE